MVCATCCDCRRNSSSAASFSHWFTRTKIATKSAKQSTIGAATDHARRRHTARGSPASTSMSGSATRTPSVSPLHQVSQLIGRSAAGTTPSAHMPASESVVLVRQNAGASRRKEASSRGASSEAG